jgi:transcriptional regulator with XRE-family HTH domain
MAESCERPHPEVTLNGTAGPCDEAMNAQGQKRGMGHSNGSVLAAGDDHPLRRLRRRRGLTQDELAGLAGLSSAFISMIETGQRRLSRLDHITAVAAVLRVSPADLAPGTVPALDGQPPLSLVPARAFPAGTDEITMARHMRLAGELLAYLARGDSCGAGLWLRRKARDPGVSPWLLLDLVARRKTGSANISRQAPARAGPVKFRHGPVPPQQLRKKGGQRRSARRDGYTG